MGKLRVITPGIAPAEFTLAPGVHRVGREADNDWQLGHASVSSHHCVVTVAEGAVRLRDLGSTNGSFVNGEPVEDVPLIPGQSLRLGDVELAFEADERFAMPGVGLALQAHPEGRQNELAPSAGFAERFIPQINRPSALPPIEMPPDFFASLKGAFKYPVVEGAWLLMILGTLFFGALEVVIFVLKFMVTTGLAPLVFRAGVGLVIVVVFGAGYLFAYIQCIITATAAGDHRLPDWPDLSSFLHDIVVPAMQVFLVWGLCLSPAVAFLVFAPDTLTPMAVPLALVGFFYLPMALLAVALLDTVMAMNPLVIVPSMLRIPKAYLATCGILLLILAGQSLMRFALTWLLGLPILPGLICGFFSFYFVCVMARILGLLFFYHREELRWV